MTLENEAMTTVENEVIRTDTAASLRDLGWLGFGAGGAGAGDGLVMSSPVGLGDPEGARRGGDQGGGE